MKTKWKEDADGDLTEPCGCELSEYETDLLIRLAGRLSQDFLTKKGFTVEEALTIQYWSYAI